MAEIVFREFIYIDINRIQSIIAQLQEGLLKEIISGKQKEVSGKAGVGGLLTHLLPISGEMQGKYGTDARQNKILHDYAYNVALDSLQEKGFLIEIDEFEREEFPITESAFILTQGRARIFDYKTLFRLWENRFRLRGSKASNTSPLTSATKNLSRQQRRQLERQNQNPPKDDTEDDASPAKALYETFYEEAIQINLTNTQNVTTIGFLNREHLREDIRNLIFKFGSEFQGEWIMLAQVSRIPEFKERKNLFEETEQRVSEIMDRLTLEDLPSGSYYFSTMLEAMNTFQEAMSSVGYPDVAVSPIAIYREVLPLR